MMDMHFVHAKNIYSDYLKQIKRSYEEVCTYHGSREDRLRLLELVRQYTKLLDEVYNDEVNKWKNHLFCKDTAPVQKD